MRVVLLLQAVGLTLAAAEEAAPLFERDILPILSAHCWKCHGMEERKAGLDLRTPPLIMRGSDRGPVVVKGSSSSSLLFRKIESGQMPPGKELKPRPEQVETLRRWIDRGAEAARSYGAPTSAEQGKVTEKDRDFWSFRVLSRPQTPGVTHAAANPVDAFLRSRLQAKNLGYAPPADRRALIRRVWFDLAGLPPPPADVDAFVASSDAAAYEKLVDGLLGSPHFGERWGRHWLDAAGYADVHGIDSNVSIIRSGEGKWRYRDWVVRAYNEDKPYDEFLREQIAGDEVDDWRGAKTFTPKTIGRLEATGFLRTAADDTDVAELDIALIRYRVLNLTIQNLTSNVLGLTVACAQCHSHKYDPISQLDYYRLMAILQPAFNPQSWPRTKDRFLADVPPSERAEVDKHNQAVDTRIKPLREQLATIRKPYEERILARKLLILPEPLRADAKAALDTPAAKRSDIEKYLVRKLGAHLAVPATGAEEMLEGEDKVRYSAVRAEINEIEKDRRSYGKLQALYDVGPPPPSYLLRRGNHETPAGPIEPGFLAVLTGADRPVTIPAAPSDSPTSGRRLALARWLTEPGAPAGSLVARVMVNRIWRHLFGEGFVDPPDNFGKMGAAPTHPELLEWLAADFVAGGWSVKKTIRRIVLSDAYRQASHRPDALEAEKLDPGNRLLWRMRLRRMESEVIRDSVLAASNSLDRTLGGPSVKMDYRPDGMVVTSKKDLPSPMAEWRRSLYLFTRRNFNMTMLSAFDQPVMDTNCTRRNTSAVVQQSLTMLNDTFILDQADRLGSRVAAEAGPAIPGRIDRAFQVLFSRAPSAKEVAWSTDALRQFEDRYRTAGKPAPEARDKALAALCHTLLNTSEFLYVH